MGLAIEIPQCMSYGRSRFVEVNCEIGAAIRALNLQDLLPVEADV